MALVLAPIVFVAGWAWAGTSLAYRFPHQKLVHHYSPRHHAISDLASDVSPRRWFMFAVFLAFGVLMLIGSQALRRSSLRLAWPAAVVNGLAVIGVALFPLRFPLDDRPGHSVAATVAYVSLAAMPLLAARGLSRAGHGALATASVMMGVLSLLVLASAMGSGSLGYLQRAGLGIGDLWILLAGLGLLKGSVAADPPA